MKNKIEQFPLDYEKLLQLGLKKAQEANNNQAKKYLSQSFKIQPSLTAYREYVALTKESERYLYLNEFFEGVNLDLKIPSLVKVYLHSLKYRYPTDANKRLSLISDVIKNNQIDLKSCKNLSQLAQKVSQEANQDNQFNSYLAEENHTKAQFFLAQKLDQNLAYTLDFINHRLDYKQAGPVLAGLIENDLTSPIITSQLLEKLAESNYNGDINVTKYTLTDTFNPKDLKPAQSNPIFQEEKEQVYLYCQDTNPHMEEFLTRNFALYAYSFYPFEDRTYLNFNNWLAVTNNNTNSIENIDPKSIETIQKAIIDSYQFSELDWSNPLDKLLED